MTALQVPPRRLTKPISIVAVCLGAALPGLPHAGADAASDLHAHEMSCTGEPRDEDEIRRVLDHERSDNQQVANELSKSGDALTEARPIQHWAYFATNEGRAAFIALIAQQFSDFESNMNPMSPGKEHAVTFWHIGTPDAESMAKINGLLRLAAESCGGEYDGWETQVIH